MMRPAAIFLGQRRRGFADNSRAKIEPLPARRNKKIWHLLYLSICAKINNI